MAMAMEVGVMHWLHVLWFDYAWQSDMGNGPEALQQTVVYGILAAIFIPVVRAFVKREMKKLHAKLDHVIHFHPDIPPFEEKPDAE